MVTSRDLNQMLKFVKKGLCPCKTGSFPWTSMLGKREVLPKRVCTDKRHA